MMATRGSGSCGRACRRRSASIPSRVPLKGSDGDARYLRLAAQPIAVRRDVLRRVHGAARHSDRRLLAATDRRRLVGGAGPDRLGADSLSNCRDRRDPAVGPADPRFFDPLVVHRLGRGFHRRQPALRPSLEHREHDRVPGAARAARRLDDPDRVHLIVLLFRGATPRLLRRGDRDDRLGRAHPGPVIGGWITDTLNWHWLFYVNLLPGVAIAILGALLVRIDEPDLKLLKGADYPGIALMAIALGTLEYVLEEGSRWNWFDDPTIRTCAWVAAIAGILFVIRSLTFARPVVDLRALGNRNFAVGCFLSFVTGIGIFSTIYMTPLFLGYVRGFSAWQTGVAIFSTGAASLVGVPVYIVLARKFDTRWLMMLGLASFAMAMWSFSFITHDWGADQLLSPQVLRGFPQVFAVAPAVTLGLGSLPPERLKYASGLFNMMRNLGGAVGIAVCGAILNNQTNLHFLYIASHLTPANGAMAQLLRGMTERWGGALGGPVAGH